MNNVWPKQSECAAYYGDPRGANGKASSKWEAANLVYIAPPFKMQMGDIKITRLRVHKKVAESLVRILNKIWDAAGKSQSKIDEWGASQFGGAYNYRLMRGGAALSMHSYGCAIDLDPARNGFHDATPNFANIPQVVAAFESEGWTWGGRWRGLSCDGMHFQAARV